MILGASGVENKYTVSLVLDMAISRCFPTDNYATKGIEYALYEGGSTLHSVLGLRLDDKENGYSSTRCSRYGTQSHKDHFLRSIAFVILDETLMMDHERFESAIINWEISGFPFPRKVPLHSDLYLYNKFPSNFHGLKSTSNGHSVPNIGWEVEMEMVDASISIFWITWFRFRDYGRRL